MSFFNVHVVFDTWKTHAVCLLSLCGFLFLPCFNPVPARAGETYEINCPGSAITYNDFTNTGSETTYRFSGSCSQNWGSDALPNFSIAITGIWKKSEKKAVERIESMYGSYRKTTSCEHDPWLDPTESCQGLISHFSQTSEQKQLFTSVVDQKVYFDQKGPNPMSRSAIADYRSDIIKKILAQSIRIVGPANASEFARPDQVTVVAELDQVVDRDSYPADMVVVLKGEEVPQWPDPNEAPQPPPRSFSIGKKLVLGAGKPVVYFPLGEQNLWGGTWLVTAHLLVADPTWSNAVNFKVKSNSTLGMPPQAQSSLHLISPQQGQKIFGNVLVKCNIEWGAVNGVSHPPVHLDWWWSPPSAPGAWPATPQQMDVQEQMQGCQKVIPRKRFTKAGLWRVRASYKISPNITIADDVSFTIQEIGMSKAQLNTKPNYHPKPLLPQAANQQGKAHAMSMQGGMAQKAKIQIRIVSPHENQHFNRTGFIPLAAHVSSTDARLVWQVEYKPFKSQSFNRYTMQKTAMMQPQIGLVKTSRLRTNKNGYYRFRVREDGAFGHWSAWRTIMVGKPVAPARAVLKKSPLPARLTGVQKTMPSAVVPNIKTSPGVLPSAAGPLKKSPAVPRRSQLKSP